MDRAGEQFYAGWNSLLQACSGSFHLSDTGMAWRMVAGIRLRKKLLGLVFMDATEAPAGPCPALYKEEKRFLGGCRSECSGWPARIPATPTLSILLHRLREIESFALKRSSHGWLEIAPVGYLRPGNPASPTSLAARHIAEQVRKYRAGSFIVKTSPNFYISLPATWKDYL